jgi:hypothetical protein
MGDGTSKGCVDTREAEVHAGMGFEVVDKEG